MCRSCAGTRHMAVRKRHKKDWRGPDLPEPVPWGNTLSRQVRVAVAHESNPPRTPLTPATGFEDRPVTRSGALSTAKS